jgi:hypothetical protein
MIGLGIIFSLSLCLKRPSLPRDDTGRPVGDVVRRVELLLAGAEDGVEVVDGVEAVVVERKLPERKEKPVL